MDFHEKTTMTRRRKDIIFIYPY